MAKAGGGGGSMADNGGVTAGVAGTRWRKMQRK